LKKAMSERKALAAALPRFGPDLRRNPNQERLEEVDGVNR